MRTKDQNEKPFIPPDTCPHIDRVLELAELLKTIEDPSLKDQCYTIIESEMEYIRASNSLLRSASKYWYEHRKKV